MHNTDALILSMGLFFIFCLGLLIALTGHAEIGCHTIGTEINGDNTIEYLQFGRC